MGSEREKREGQRKRERVSGEKRKERVRSVSIGFLERKKKMRMEKETYRRRGSKGDRRRERKRPYLFSDSLDFVCLLKARLKLLGK